MFPVHSAPRSLSRQMSPSSWLDCRDISSAGAGSVPTAPREGFAGTGLATRLMGNSSVLFHHGVRAPLFQSVDVPSGLIGSNRLPPDPPSEDLQARGHSRNPEHA